jgi:ataxin-3
MQSHQDHPECVMFTDFFLRLQALRSDRRTQLAFILNLDQHWFSLRRFGPVSGNVQGDASRSHWFNLNSFLSAPERVSNLYLGMVLQQAEAEGPSPFPNNILMLKIYRQGTLSS